MTDLVSLSWFQWVSVVEIPVLLFLVSQYFKERRAMDKAINSITAAVSEFKIEVAKEYATLSVVKDSEARLIKTIDKLDTTIDRLATEIHHIANGVQRNTE